jgi:hypothetical protein
LHQVAALGHADLVVEQLAQGFQGTIFLFQRGQALERVATQDVETCLIQARYGKQVDHFVGIDRAAHDLPNGGVHVALAAGSGVTHIIVSQTLADHVRTTLEKAKSAVMTVGS